MVIFSSTALAIQAIKLAIFFITLGLPAADGGPRQARKAPPVAALHDIERPFSNPRRKQAPMAR